MLPEPPPPFRPLIGRLRALREDEQALARTNPLVAQAMEREKREGHRLAVIVRTIALSIVFVFLPFLNWHPSVLLYQAMLLIFIALGWLQLRVARSGFSGWELALIYADIALMTLVVLVPNPWQPEPLPLAYNYRFDTFLYFFVILAVATLAYSWRTVWAIGTQIALVWGGGVLLVLFFSDGISGLTEAVSAAFPDKPGMATDLDPNSVQGGNRVQEMVVIILVAGILAVKGWRSNRLLIEQASIATERANLSRYFPDTMVETLASADHDIGAVREEEVAVLFTDIVGFTQQAENMKADDVMEMLRGYHELVERAIFDHSGTLDKYLGDGVMATFGTPVPGADDAANALAAAQQIVRDGYAWGETRVAEGKPIVAIAVGVHFGPVIMGDIGSERRLEFAVLGDTVNVAARVETATRDLGCRLAATDAVVSRAGGPDAALGLTGREGVLLKGRKRPVTLWTD
ncbi:MAG: adenylate/guanylate cyclase domain-containing protein [Pseudomonadota bacterium]